MSIYILFLSLVSALNPFVNSYVYANDMSLLMERTYFEIGYKSVEQALDEFENHFKRDLKLPIEMPPVPFTHRFGRFNDLEGDINDNFEIEYLNEQSGKTHYKINIKPAEQGLKLEKRYIEDKYRLKDGTEAIYSTSLARGFNLLIFDNEGWQYVLSVDKRIANKVTAQVLVDIANSIK